MLLSQLIGGVVGLTSSLHATTVHWLISASICPPFLIMALSLLPSRFFTTRHLILPDKSQVGGILTEMHSLPPPFKSRQLLTHPSWLTSRLLTSSQPMKQLGMYRVPIFYPVPSTGY